MPPVKGKGKQQWDVKNGKVVLVTPAEVEKSEEVPVAQLDRVIERAERKKERAEAALAEAQATLDEATAYEEGLKALRASVPE
jgi:hypothetical protein